MRYTAAQIIATHPHVLLDFDGPVCAVFGGTSDQAVADRLRAILGGNLPGIAGTCNDPFDVLVYAATRGPDTLTMVENEFRRQEVAAVATAPLTPGIRDVLDQLTAAGHTVTIVSNNSADAVATYLRYQSLASMIHGISARIDPDPALLKPSPHLLDQAIHKLDTTPDQCVLVGDSISDIQAARAAGTAVIAYANKPDKRDRFEPYRPDAIIGDIVNLSPDK